ncbi:MAG: PEP-CTERM sorting domain-containing protein [Phycisphaerae bacterium]|nr:PEP-CTERM sorting domain-containing protein [Phycisphaerae bacterium]
MTRRRAWYVVAGALASVWVSASPALADPNVDTYGIDVDAKLDSRDPTFNCGTDTTMKIVVNGDDESLARAVIELPEEIWNIPYSVTSVKVYAYLYSNKTYDRTVRLHPLTRGFLEGTGDEVATGDGATWLTYDGVNAWTTPGGDYDAATYVDPVESGNWFIWDITSLYGNTDLRDYGALLRTDNESFVGADDMPRAPFTSSDGSSAEWPYVEVTYYVPEPGTLALFGLLAGLAVRRRRR